MMRRQVAVAFAATVLLAFGNLAPANEAASSAKAADGAAFEVLQKAAQQHPLLLAQAAPPVTGQLQIEPGDDAPADDAAPVKFYEPLDVDDPAIKGKSIEQLIVGSPLFPPIEGLDKSIWQGKNCGTCHQWTKERLCVQAKTYVGAEKMVTRLQHPYGLAFKEVLERWGEGGCQ